MTDDTVRRMAIEEAIRANVPNVQEVEFEDAEHVLLLLPPGETWTRYRIGAETQQFLLGEFPDDDDTLPRVVLLAPDSEGQA
jgi:hypothetical protein